MPELEPILVFLRQLLTDPLPHSNGRMAMIVSTIGGGVLGTRWMWNRLSPLLHWPHRYSVIERVEKVTDQKKLLANPVYQHSGSFLFLSGLLGALVGYVSGSIFWRLGLKSQPIYQAMIGLWGGALLHTFFVLYSQLRSFAHITYNWTMGIPSTINRPQSFKLELYDKVFHKHWFGSEPNFSLVSWAAFVGIFMPTWSLATKLA
eukprot:TRINITY_DN13500_c0_g1_i1.p1 TRINITY_DN13500_c0_g1~~TRINITY_DN13500_c0_g1_i1.p1  ORF type:complete len:204 (-),score=24.68 TRINITY_DN13500_c0_g1_i1:117-728(-)